MSKGDTTVHIDFEVGGASAAKMTVMDVYRAQQANASKLNEAARAMSKEQGISFSDAKKAIREYVNMTNKAANEIAAANKAADAKATAAAVTAAKKEESIEKERARKEEKIRDEERRAQRRAAELAVADAKWEAREKLKESKRVAREKKRDLEIQQNQRGAMGSLVGRGLWGAAMGVAGYAGVAGVSNIISGLTEAVTNFADKRAELERVITPLTSIGDNIGKLSAVRKEVVSISAATGMSADTTAQFLNSMESSTGNLDPEIIRDLKNEIVELTQVKGGNIGEMGDMMVSAWQIAGKEMKNVNELQNKIAYTEEIGKAKISELAKYLPTILNVGDLLGISADQTLGTVAGGSFKTGDIQKLMTGMRNFYLIMEQAPSKGVNLTGTYVQKMEQLNELFKTNRSGMIDLFDREVVDAAYQIVSQIDTVKEKITEMENMPSTQDIVGEKLKARLEDITSASAALNSIYKTLNDQAANLTSESDMNTWMYAMNERAEAGRLGGKSISGGSNLGGTFGATASVLGFNKFTEAGVKKAIDWTAPGPQRDLLLKQQFELQKDSELKALYGTNEMAVSKWGGVFGQDWDSDRIKEIKGRQFNVEEARARNPYSETAGPAMASAEAVALVEALKENTRALTNSGGGSKQVAKPGGGTTNNTETR